MNKYRNEFKATLLKHSELFKLNECDLNKIREDIRDDVKLNTMIKLTNLLMFILDSSNSKSNKPNFDSKIKSNDVINYIIKDNNIVVEYISDVKMTLCLIMSGFIYKKIEENPTFNIDLKSYDFFYSINGQFIKNCEMKRINLQYDTNNSVHLYFKQYLIDRFNIPTNSILPYYTQCISKDYI